MDEFVVNDLSQSLCYRVSTNLCNFWQPGKKAKGNHVVDCNILHRLNIVAIDSRLGTSYKEERTFVLVDLLRLIQVLMIRFHIDQ